MTAFTIQDVSRRSGLSEPTLRYYEEVGEMSCPIWSSTTTAPATSSAGGRVPPRPRSWKPRKACATSDSSNGINNLRLSLFGNITNL
jgi:hypothetical protein